MQRKANGSHVYNSLKIGDRVIVEDTEKDRVRCRFLGVKNDVLLFCLDDTCVIDGDPRAKEHPHPASREGSHPAIVPSEAHQRYATARGASKEGEAEA
jgi:hypothetical protein